MIEEENNYLNVHYPIYENELNLTLLKLLI